MLEHRFDVTGKLVTVEPTGKITPADFEKVARAIDGYLHMHGELHGLVVQAASFEDWDEFVAHTGHLKLMREHHRQIQRVAIVSDAELSQVIPQLARHFVAADLEQFPAENVERAASWAAA